MTIFRGVIRWHLKDLLARKGWTAYRLAQEARLALPVAYRLSHDPRATRIEAATLEALCLALDVLPGELLTLDGTKAVTHRKRHD